MIRPFRCQHCSEYPATFDFYAEDVGSKVACPKCGITKAEFPDHIVPLVLMHFDPPRRDPQGKKIDGRGLRHRACDPAKGSTLAKPEDGLMHGATGHAPAVNCPECRKSQAYLTATAGLEPDQVWRPFDENGEENNKRESTQVVTE